MACLEQHFGQRVLKITAPGGKGRASYRACFETQSVIVTYRPKINRTRLEAHVLRALGPHSADIPKFLGIRDGLLFQSDLGATRLSQAIQAADAADRHDLAAEAVASIFRIHSAARKTDLVSELPHLGATRPWVAAVVDAVDKLAPYLHQQVPALDRPALCAALDQPAAQFLKWDCRSGNASPGADGRVGWFDFEYAGLRHGAEDFAWLIGDEIWPVAPAAMFEILADAFDPASGHARDAYLDYLALYTTFHAIQRILLILAEVKRRGWSSQARAVQYDKVGTHPMLGARLAGTAAFCADRSRLTRPLVPMLDATARLFADAMPQPRLAG